MDQYVFQPGDLVKVVNIIRDSGHVLNKIGTYRGHGAVEFDAPFPGSHSCRGRCPSGNGWWVDDCALELIQSAQAPFDPAPEADFLSLLGGFSESEVSHA